MMYLKSLFCILIIATLSLSTVGSSLALDHCLDETNQCEIKNKKIEQIFDRLGELGLRSEFLNHHPKTKLNLLSSLNSTHSLAAIEKKQLDLELEKLGIKTLDGDNPEDMKILQELFETSIYPSSGEDSVVDLMSASPPDLSAYAKMYSIYISSGYYTIKDVGKRYQYRYIRVVDDKGVGRLRLIEQYDAGPNSIKNRININDAINYTFEWLKSEFLGYLPGPANWSLGYLFNLTTPSNLKYHSSKALYQITFVCNTQMIYDYINDNGNWIFVGSRSKFKLLTDHVMYGFIGSSPKKYPREWYYNGKSGPEFWYDMVKYYHYNKNLPGALPARYRIGRLGVKGFFNDKFYFTPEFADYPSWL